MVALKADGGGAGAATTEIADGYGAGDPALLTADGGPARWPETITGVSTMLMAARSTKAAGYMQGDPRLILGPDGSRLQFTGGQPLTDQGLENLVLISLFTSPGWCGNRFMRASIGSDFEEACRKPITRTSLNEVRQAAELALQHPALGQVQVAVTNPSGHRLNISIRIAPGGVTRGMMLTREGESWSFQANTPAYPHIQSTVKPLPTYEVTLGGAGATFNGEAAKW